MLFYFNFLPFSSFPCPSHTSFPLPHHALPTSPPLVIRYMSMSFDQSFDLLLYDMYVFIYNTYICVYVYIGVLILHFLFCCILLYIYIPYDIFLRAYILFCIYDVNVFLFPFLRSPELVSSLLGAGPMVPGGYVCSAVMDHFRQLPPELRRSARTPPSALAHWQMDRVSNVTRSRRRYTRRHINSWRCQFGDS